MLLALSTATECPAGYNLEPAYLYVQSLSFEILVQSRQECAWWCDAYGSRCRGFQFVRSGSDPNSGFVCSGYTSAKLYSDESYRDYITCSKVNGNILEY